MRYLLIALVLLTACAGMKASVSPELGDERLDNAQESQEVISDTIYAEENASYEFRGKPFVLMLPKDSKEGALVFVRMKNNCVIPEIEDIPPEGYFQLDYGSEGWEWRRISELPPRIVEAPGPAELVLDVVGGWSDGCFIMKFEHIPKSSGSP